MAKKELSNREQARLLRANLDKKPNLDELEKRVSKLEKSVDESVSEQSVDESQLQENASEQEQEQENASKKQGKNAKK